MSNRNSISILAKFQKIIDALNNPLSFIALIFGLSAVYFSVVEWRVKSIVEDPDFINNLALRVRPSIVFDADGRILADNGALDLLEEVPKVLLPNKGDNSHTAKIIITPKRMISEPIIECMDYSYTAVAAQKIKGLSWEVTIKIRGYPYENNYDVDDPELLKILKELPPPRYRLDLSSN